MPETVAAEPKPIVTIHDAGPSLKRISIEIPAETVSGKLKESIDTLAVEAQLPGFRKGHVPRSLVEKRFGAAVRAEAKSQLVAAAYSQAIEDNKLKVIGEPVSPSLEKVEVEDGKPLVFELEVEVVPEFTMPPLEGLDVQKPTMEITDQAVDDEIKKIQINEGDLESREAPEPGDYLTGHGVMKSEGGQEFYNLQGAVVQVPAPEKEGKGMILGVMIEDFTTQFGLPKAGDTVTVKTLGPENHEVEDLRGKKLEITFKVDRIDRIKPAPLDKVVAALGMQSEQQLRDAIRTRMQQRALMQQQVVMRQQLAKKLVDATTIDLPKRLTANQSARTLERQRLELMYRGVEPLKIEEHMAELRAASGHVAVNELKLLFILNNAGETLGIKVSEAEINGRIAQLAQENNVRPEKLRQDMINSNRIAGIYQQIREHKTMDAILSKAKVTEVSAEEFNRTQKEKAKG